jgi:chromosome partitioning protein
VSSRVIAIATEKGGTAKTTTAVHLAEAFARLDRRVLVVDLDPQFNLTLWIADRNQPPECSIWDVFQDVTQPVARAIGPSVIPGVDLLYGTRRLGDVESILSQLSRPVRVLRRALASVPDYDVILIDCPPSVGRLPLNALTAATDVIIPVNPSDLALIGMRQIFASLRRLLEDDEERAEFPSTRVLLTVWNERLRIAKDIVAVLEDEQREVFATRIAATTRFAELSSRRATIFTYDPDGSGANDYMSLAQEIARAS